MTAPKRHLVQARPKGPQSENVRSEYYAPERDLAHVGVKLIHAAMHALDDQYQEPWFKDFMRKYDVQVNELGKGAQLLASALNHVISVKDPVTALQIVGFDKLPPPVQMALYCKMGQVLLSATWSGIKDVKMANSLPPMSVKDLLDDAELWLQHFRALAGLEAAVDMAAEREDDETQRGTDELV